MRIENHLIDSIASEVRLVEGKDSGPFAAGQPDTIIIHYTASDTYDATLRALVDPKHRASAHVLIGRDGKIGQLVPFNTIAWHAGKSSWGARQGLNYCSIGIEIVNAGPLERKGDGYVSWWGKQYGADEVVQATHRNETKPGHWHRYSIEQTIAVRELCVCLARFYGITEILGHEEIAPGRKQDPGPAFDLDGLRKDVLGKDTSERGSMVVAADTLNVRQGPGSNHPLAGDPLTRGTKTRILDRQGGWTRVEVVRQGWVADQFLSTP